MATGMQGLLVWCKMLTKPYGEDVAVKNMTTSWKNGLAFCAIIHHYRPDLIDFNKLSKENIAANNELAFTTAEEELGIPALLDVEDMVEMKVPDRLSIMTYVSQYYNYFKDKVPGEIEPRKVGSKKRPNKEPSETLPAKRGVDDQKHQPIIQKTTMPTVKKNVCFSCGKIVYLMERLSIEGKLFHRVCFKCVICGKQLKNSTYEYDKLAEKFYCTRDFKEKKENKGAPVDKNGVTSTTPSQETEHSDSSETKNGNIKKTLKSPFKRNEPFKRQGIHPQSQEISPVNEGEVSTIKSKESSTKVTGKGKPGKSFFSGVLGRKHHEFTNPSYDKQLDLTNFMNKINEPNEPLLLSSRENINPDVKRVSNYEQIDNLSRAAAGSNSDSNNKIDQAPVEKGKKEKDSKGNKKKLVLKLKKKKDKKVINEDKSKETPNNKRYVDVSDAVPAKPVSPSKTSAPSRESEYENLGKYVKMNSVIMRDNAEKIYDNVNLCKVITAKEEPDLKIYDNSNLQPIIQPSDNKNRDYKDDKTIYETPNIHFTLKGDSHSQQYKDTVLYESMDTINKNVIDSVSSDNQEGDGIYVRVSKNGHVACTEGTVDSAEEDMEVSSTDVNIDTDECNDRNNVDDSNLVSSEVTCPDKMENINTVDIPSSNTTDQNMVESNEQKINDIDNQLKLIDESIASSDSEMECDVDAKNASENENRAVVTEDGNENGLENVEDSHDVPDDGHDDGHDENDDNVDKVAVDDGKTNDMAEEVKSSDNNKENLDAGDVAFVDEKGNDTDDGADDDKSCDDNTDDKSSDDIDVNNDDIGNDKSIEVMIVDDNIVDKSSEIMKVDDNIDDNVGEKSSDDMNVDNDLDAEGIDDNAENHNLTLEKSFKDESLSSLIDTITDDVELQNEDMIEYSSTSKPTQHDPLEDAEIDASTQSYDGDKSSGVSNEKVANEVSMSAGTMENEQVFDGEDDNAKSKLVSETDESIAVQSLVIKEYVVEDKDVDTDSASLRHDDQDAADTDDSFPVHAHSDHCPLLDSEVITKEVNEDLSDHELVTSKEDEVQNDATENSVTDSEATCDDQTQHVTDSIADEPPPEVQKDDLPVIKKSRTVKAKVKSSDTLNPFLSSSDSSLEVSMKKDSTNPFLSSSDEVSDEDDDFATEEFDESNPFAEDVRLERSTTLERAKTKLVRGDTFQIGIIEESNPFADDVLDPTNPFSDEFEDDDDTVAPDLKISNNTESTQVPEIVSSLPKSGRKLVLKSKSGNIVRKSSADGSSASDYKPRPKKRTAPKAPINTSAPNTPPVPGRPSRKKRAAPKPPDPGSAEKVNFYKDIYSSGSLRKSKRKAPRPPMQMTFEMKGELDSGSDVKSVNDLPDASNDVSIDGVTEDPECDSFKTETNNDNPFDSSSVEDESIADGITLDSTHLDESTLDNDCVDGSKEDYEKEADTSVSGEYATEGANEEQSYLEGSNLTLESADETSMYVTADQSFFDTSDTQEQSHEQVTLDTTEELTNKVVQDDAELDLAYSDTHSDRVENSTLEISNFSELSIASSESSLPQSDVISQSDSIVLQGHDMNDDKSTSSYKEDSSTECDGDRNSINEQMQRYEDEELKNLKIGTTHSLPHNKFTHLANTDMTSSLPNIYRTDKQYSEKRKAPDKPPRQYKELGAIDDDNSSYKHSKREEMTKELQFLEVKQRELEMEGVVMEKKLRECSDGEHEEAYLLTWFELVNQKNQLLRRENELIYMCQEMDFLQNQRSAEFELRQLMMKPDDEKTEYDTNRETELLAEILSFVTKRSNLIDQMDEDRIREEEEDKEISDMLAARSLKTASTTDVNENSKSEKKKKKVKDKVAKEKKDSKNRKKSKESTESGGSTRSAEKEKKSGKDKEKSDSKSKIKLKKERKESKENSKKLIKDGETKKK